MTLAHFAALVRRGRRTKRHEPMLQLRSLKAQDLKYQGLSSQVMHARPSSESPRYLWIWTLRENNNAIEARVKNEGAPVLPITGKR